MAEDHFRQPLLQPSAAPGSRKHGYDSINHNDCTITTQVEVSINPDYEVQSEDSIAYIHRSNPSEEFKLYKRRWYILSVFSLFAGTQALVWNTFGPISVTVEDAFGWDNSTVALLSNWGPIAYLISGLFFSWMMDIKGLRLSCIISAFLVAVGTALRCVTMETPTVTVLMHIGQFLNGLGGPVSMAAPPILSATWFPQYERTTATGVGIIAGSMGVAFAFILGPFMVTNLEPSNRTDTSRNVSSDSFLSDTSENWQPLTLMHAANTSDKNHRLINERKAVQLYMYIVAGWSIALFLIILIYFPNKPSLPPCASASIQREDFLKGLRSLIRNRSFWLLAIVYGLSLGTIGGWISVLDVILKSDGISEKEAGWIGFYATCISCALVLLVARFADYFSRINKWLILNFLIIAIVVMVLFALSYKHIIPPSTVLFYVTTIIGYSALNAATPLIYELGCELAYPTGEGITNGILTIINNLAGVIFLFIMMVPNIGIAWTNWAVVGTSIFCLPLLLMMKETYKRLEIDEQNPTVDCINREISIPSP